MYYSDLGIANRFKAKMDHLSKVVKTAIVVIAAAVVSVPLAMISWAVMIRWHIPVSIGIWVVDLLPSKDGGMSEGLDRTSTAFCIDLCLYFGAICLLALVAERRHQRRAAAAEDH
jgi:hypothetical protein